MCRDYICIEGEKEIHFLILQRYFWYNWLKKKSPAYLRCLELMWGKNNKKANLVQHECFKSAALTLPMQVVV